MKRILITGGDGYFGKAIVDALQSTENIVRVMSRKPRPDTLTEPIEWAQADVVSGEGLDSAVQGVDVIVNCLSSPVQDTYETDILGTRKLLNHAKSAGVDHILHISIIGIDRVIFQYFQYKLGAELEVIESGIPYTIARIAQFHGFVDYIISALHQVESDEVHIPVDVKFQPIDVTEAAQYLIPYIVGDEAQGRIDDLAGSEILRFEDMVSAWLSVHGKTKTIQPATADRNDTPFLNAGMQAGYINGYNTNPDNAYGEVSWGDYLQQMYGMTV